MHGERPAGRRDLLRRRQAAGAGREQRREAEQTAATARNRGANTASRPPAPIASPISEALSASPSDRLADGPERVGEPGGMRDERCGCEIERGLVEGRARGLAPRRVQGRGRGDQIEQDDEKSAQRMPTPGTRRIIVQGRRARACGAL